MIILIGKAKIRYICVALLQWFATFCPLQQNAADRRTGLDKPPHILYQLRSDPENMPFWHSPDLMSTQKKAFDVLITPWICRKLKETTVLMDCRRQRIR
jgi:hypothetical protein